VNGEINIDRVQGNGEIKINPFKVQGSVAVERTSAVKEQRTKKQNKQTKTGQA
jgi:hypothetical protein